MSTPSIGSKYRHRYLVDYEAPDTQPQLPNVFTVVGSQPIKVGFGLTTVEYIGLVQEEQTEPLPTWWAPTTFDDNFEPLPLVQITIPPSIL